MSKIYQCIKCSNACDVVFIHDLDDTVSVLDSVLIGGEEYHVLHETSSHDYFLPKFNDGATVYYPGYPNTIHTFELAPSTCIPLDPCTLTSYLCNDEYDFLYRTNAERQSILNNTTTTGVYLESYVRSGTNRFYEDFNDGVNNLADSDSEDISYIKGLKDIPSEVLRIPSELLEGGSMYTDLTTTWNFLVPSSVLTDPLNADIFEGTGITDTSNLEGLIQDMYPIINTSAFDIQDIYLNKNFDVSKSIFNEVYGPEGSYTSMAPCRGHNDVIMLKPDVLPGCNASWDNIETGIKYVNDSAIAHYDTGTLENNDCSINRVLLHNNDALYNSGSYLMKDIKPWILQSKHTDYLSLFPLGKADYLYNCERALFAKSIMLQNHLNENYDVDSTLSMFAIGEVLDRVDLGDKFPLKNSSNANACKNEFLFFPYTWVNNTGETIDIRVDGSLTVDDDLLINAVTFEDGMYPFHTCNPPMNGGHTWDNNYLIKAGVEPGESVRFQIVNHFSRPTGAQGSVKMVKPVLCNDTTNGNILDNNNNTPSTEFTSSLELTINAELNKFRDYKKVGTSSELVWLSYQVENSRSIGSTTISNPTVDQILKPINIFDNISNSYDPFYDYEHIEVVAGLTRGSTTASGLHKSTIYSVVIKDSGLNENILNILLRLEIQKNVETVIRETLPDITPVETTLWKIIWEGL